MLDPCVPPHSVDAEMATLGACLYGSDPAAVKLVSSVIRSAQDFYKSKHRTIYSAIMKLVAKKEAVDILTLSEFLRDSGTLDEIGEIEYLSELIHSVYTSANADHYALIVREKAARREAIYIAADLDSKARDEENDFQAELDEAKTKIVNIALGRENDEMTPIRDGVQRMSAEIDRCLENGGGIFSGKYVPTGFADIDRLIGGWFPGVVSILGARPGMGKTTFLLENCLKISDTRPVALFSFEDPEVFIISKAIAMETSINSREIQRGPITMSMHKDITAANNRLFNKRLYYHDRSCSVSDMRRKSRKILAIENDLAAIFIDRVEFIRDDARRGENRNNQLTRLSAEVVDMAREFNVPVILVVQLSRDVEKRGDKRPVKSDLRDSGAFEQDARMIMMLYRDDYYNRNSEEKGIAEVGIVKNNHGPEGIRKLKWWGSIPRYDDAEFRYDEDDEPPRTTRRKQAERGCYDDED